MPFIPDAVDSSTATTGKFIPDTDTSVQSQPKTFYDALGANMTPEMKAAHPVLSGIEQTAQDVGTLGEKAANGLSLGLLDKGLNKVGIQPPNFDNTAPDNKSVLNLVGDAANLGAAGKTIGVLAKSASAIPIVNKGITAVGDLANKAKSGLFDLAKANQQLKNPVALDSDIRGQLFSQKTQIGKNFESDLNKLIASKPYDSVNLQEPVSAMRSAMDDANTNPGLASQIKSVIRTIKNPDAAKTLNEIIDDPSKASNLTLKQSQDLKIAIQNSPSIKMKLSQGKFANYTQGDLELLDLLDNVKLKQAENFPELAQVRKPYADYMQNYNQVKSMFKPSQLLQNVQSNFGPNAVTESMARKALPDATNKQIDNIRKVIALKKAGKWGAGLAGVGSADAVIRKIIDQ